MLGVTMHLCFERCDPMFPNRLNVPPALLGAAMYFSALFGGSLCTFVLALYVLLCESDAFVRRAAVKAAAVMVSFSVLTALIYLLPDTVNVINVFVSLFGGSFHVGFLSALANVLAVIAEFVRKVLLLWLGVQALKQTDVHVPFVDALLSKFMS